MMSIPVMRSYKRLSSTVTDRERMLQEVRTRCCIANSKEKQKNSEENKKNSENNKKNSENNKKNETCRVGV